MKFEDCIACISRVVKGKVTKILPRGKEIPVGYKGLFIAYNQLKKILEADYETENN